MCAVFWIIWLERNRVGFLNVIPKPRNVLAASIIALINFLIEYEWKEIMLKILPNLSDIRYFTDEDMSSMHVRIAPVRNSRGDEAWR